MYNQAVGRDGEEAAAKLLQLRGYQVITLNYRSGRWGEIDLVCLEGGDLVFVEVKSRHGSKFGNPIEAVSWGKLQRLRRAAHYYKLTHPQTPESLRFDVVTVWYKEPSDNDPQIEIFKNVLIG